MSSALASRIAAAFSAVEASLPGDVVDPERRRRAAAILSERGLPNARDENWKYASLRALEKVDFGPAEPDRAAPVAELPASIPGYVRYVFIDGRFDPATSTSQSASGVSVESLLQPGPPFDPASETDGTDFGFALLNDAFATDGARIRIAAQAPRLERFELVFVATRDGQAAASYPRVELEVGAGASFELIERHVSAGSDSSFVASRVNVRVARDASVRHYRLQTTAARAICFDTLSVTLEENARYRLIGVGLGGLSARSTVRVRLGGRGSEVGLFAVSVGDRGQVHDIDARIEHAAPHTRTEQVFRGIASDRARVACNGKIVVQAGAHGADSRQVLRGLLAGATAEIDVRPQLEIYTDDVQCSHGATTGKLDEDMLFYLLSRGLERDTAMRLLNWAFLEDVIARIEVPELRRQIEQSLAGQLGATAILKELP